MAFIVYDTTRIITGIYPTMAVANTNSNGGTVAEVDPLPIDAQPGDYYNSSGEIQADPPLTGLPALRFSLYAAHTIYFQWVVSVTQLSTFYDITTAGKAHDWLTYGREGAIRVARSTHWTVAERIAFINSTVTGSLNISTPIEFFESVAVTSLDAPTSSIVWVNPDNAEKTELSNARTLTNSVDDNWADLPPIEQIISGSWIAGLNA